MNKVFSIARYTIIQNIRNKIFYSIILFGIIIVGASLLLAALGGEQPERIVLDVGLAAIEIIALITACFAAVTLILEEMESKTIYLVLSRPVPRGVYLLGRFLGLLLAVYCGMAVMALMHLGLLWFNGWEFTWQYPAALFLGAIKISIMAAIALFFSLFSSSAMTSVSFTLFFWILGHFSEEIKFLGKKAPGVITQLFAQVVYYLVPNLQHLNLRDFWDVPHIFGTWLGGAAGYGVLYSCVCIVLAIVLFKKKEF